MPNPELSDLARTIVPAIPGDADVSGVSIETTTGRRVVTISTCTPERLIGPSGSTADAIRRALIDWAGAPVGLKIVDVGDPGNSAGDRHPRRPLPETPSGSVSLGEFDA